MDRGALKQYFIVAQFWRLKFKIKVLVGYMKALGKNH